MTHEDEPDNYFEFFGYRVSGPWFWLVSGGILGTFFYGIASLIRDIGALFL